MSTSAANTAERRALLMLAAGALAGLLCAAVAIVEPWHSRQRALPADAAARVNGVVISKENYARALGKLASDSRDPLDVEQRRWILERLIEEELLVQRGLELGMAASEKSVRAAIVRAMIAAVTASAESRPLDEQELRRFYAENGALFARSIRVRVAAIKAPTLDEAMALRTRALSGTTLPVANAMAPQSLVPDTPLPLAKLREYIGPKAALAAAALHDGEISAPIEVANGYLIVQMREREPDQILPFEEVREQVQAACRKHLDDEALRGYLERLKHNNKVERAPLARR